MKTKKAKKQIKRRGARLGAFMSAALAIPTVAGSLAQAQSVPDATSVRLQYADYQDYQSRGDRMHVKAPMIWMQSPLGERTAFEGSFVVDGVSGASPLYLDSVSGASGTGISDTRKAGDAKLTQYFDQFSLGFGGAYSNEKDYESSGALIDSRIWTSDKNTVFSFGLSGDRDRITSTNDATLHEDRQSFDYYTGITQVIDSKRIVQSNLAYSNADGYHSDPYKLFDNRPRSRDVMAWLTRYVEYVAEGDFSFHADYRFTYDSWQLSSHMLELAVYKPFLESWLVKPHLRYYTQSEADFFSSEVPSRGDGFFSADQRLSAFGSVTAGLMLQKALGWDTTVDADFSFMQQSSDYRFGGGSDNIKTFNATFVIVGLTKRFK